MSIKQLFKTFSVALLLLTTTQAFGGPLDIDNVTGLWANEVYAGSGSVPPTSNVDAPGQGTDSIRWGNPFAPNTMQSGYNFTPVALGSPGIVALDTPFLLGRFNHLNFPITSESLVSVDYLLNFDTNGSPAAVGPLVLSLTHDETPNAPCGNPGCDDIVTASSPDPQSAIITQGTDSYLFRLVGWSLTNDGNGIGGLSLNTIEGQQNIAYLYAEVTTAPVPEPGLLSLLGLGLLGLGVTRLRKSSKAA